MFGRQTTTAITAMIRLAEARVAQAGRLSAVQIAESEGLQPPSVAKVLTALAGAGLIKGSPGPGGGFLLVREPAQVSLADIQRVFEQDTSLPLDADALPDSVQHRVQRVREALEDLLQRTTLDELAREKPQNQAANGRNRARVH